MEAESIGTDSVSNNSCTRVLLPTMPLIESRRSPTACRDLDLKIWGILNLIRSWPRVPLVLTHW